MILYKLNAGIRRIEEILLSWGVLSMAAVTIGNVLSRKFLNHSWSFAEEVSQFILVMVTFMGISYAARKGRHIRMTALFEMMGTRLQKAAILFVSLTTMLVLFYLSYHSLLYVLKIKAYGRVTPALCFPFYLALVWVPAGLFLGGVQYGLAVIKNMKKKEVWLSFEEKSEYRELEGEVPPC